jgi:hypothetical protein
MKAIAATLAMLVTFGSSMLAQDTTPPTPAPAPAPGAVTVEAVLARTVVDRMPQDSATTFAADVGEIVLWTRVTGGEGQTLYHVWFYGDTEVGNVPLSIGGSPWRTWSRKQVPAEATGDWHVEIRDAAGNVIERLDFTIEGGAAQPPDTSAAPRDRDRDR